MDDIINYTMENPTNTNPNVLRGMLENYSGGGGGGGGRVSVPTKDVNFIDYDGTIVYSYSAADFAKLTELPANPKHKGLIAQGWNWSLSDAKTCVVANGKLNIGQMYITNDGKTRLYIHITDDARMSPTLYFSQSVSNGVTIDWGDGSATETVSGTSGVNIAHTYNSIGDYIITMTVTSGNLGLGNGTVYSQIITGGPNNARVYNNFLQAVEIGADVISINGNAFMGCYSLASITIPSTVTHIGSNVFSTCGILVSVTIPSSVTSNLEGMFTGCDSLVSIAIPNSVTSIGRAAFSSCHRLVSVAIPSSVTSIGSTVFSNSSGIASITIPEGVTSIGSQAFSNCYSMAEFHMLPTVPPTAGAKAFNGIPTDCIIYVPASADHSVLNAYKTAANYPDSTVYTYLEE